MDALRIITEEHQNLWRIAATVEQLARDLEDGQPADAALFAAIFDYLAHFEGAFLQAKAGALFPLLRQRSARAGAVLDSLESEYGRDPDCLAALRQQLAETTAGHLPSADFAATLHAYTQGLIRHVRLEEAAVMPLARETLRPDDWVAVDRVFLDENGPLSGARPQAQFRQLFHRIASLAPESIGLGAHSGGELAPVAAPLELPRVLLAVEGLESCYGRIRALKGISLEVRQGELVALVGANGAGKTTFLRTLSGVQPMSAGRIRFDGEDISGLRGDVRVRRGICQSPEGRQVFGPLSIEDNLRLGAYTQPREQVAGDLEKIYAMFPILREKRHLPAGTLSGGQQQMLAIGRALMGRPKLLLLDEPSMGLAPLLVEEVFNVVRTLKAQGMTIILAEQNAFAALAIADRGYVIETGNVVLSGSGQDLIDDEQVRSAYLGM